MIARIWHGRTAKSNYGAYSEFLKRIAVPDYEKTNGFKGLRFLRTIVGNEAHFQLITFWESLEAIKNFAGADHEKAKYYPRTRSSYWSLKKRFSIMKYLLQQPLNASFSIQ